MKEQKIKEVMFFGSTIEELVSVVEKSLSWATCEVYCLDCIQTGFPRYEMVEIAKGMLFREDIDKLVNQGRLASCKSFCESFGDNKERVKRLVDALNNVGLTAEVVDEYTKKNKMVDNKKGTSLGKLEFGGCIEKKTLLSAIRSILLEKFKISSDA